MLISIVMVIFLLFSDQILRGANCFRGSAPPVEESQLLVEDQPGVSYNLNFLFVGSYCVVLMFIFEIN